MKGPSAHGQVLDEPVFAPKTAMESDPMTVWSATVPVATEIVVLVAVLAPAAEL